MNVKTSSRLKVISIVAVLILLFVGALLYVPQSESDLDCTADINLNMDDGEQKLDARIHLAVHFVPDARSYITEYGVVNYGDQRYIVDRYVRLRYSDDSNHAFVEFQREGIDKNSSETLPEVLSQKLTSAQKVFFFKVRKLHNEIWSISDLRRTVLVCSETE